MTTTIDVKNAELTELLALAKAGNEVILAEGDTPVARLTAVEAVPVLKKRILGLHPGAMQPSDDFDDPLTEAFWLGEE